MEAPAYPGGGIAMSRNSYRGLTLALILVVSFGIALPATAGPADRGPANQDGLLARIWEWVGHLWPGAGEPREVPKPVTEAAHECERGILIDPNGKPCDN